MLQLTTLTRRDDGSFPEPDGDIVAFVGTGTRGNTLRFVVRQDEPTEPDITEVPADPEDLPTRDELDDVHYCTGTTADGSHCTREVDAAGDTCYQH